MKNIVQDNVQECISNGQYLRTGQRVVYMPRRLHGEIANIHLEQFHFAQEFVITLKLDDGTICEYFRGDIRPEVLQY